MKEELIREDSKFTIEHNGKTYHCEVTSELLHNRFFYLNIKTKRIKNYLFFNLWVTDWEYRHLMGYWKLFDKDSVQYENIHNDRWYNPAYIKNMFINALNQYERAEKTKQEEANRNVQHLKSIK